MDIPTLQKLFGVIAYLAILLGIGVVASRRMKDLRDFVVAGKKLRFFAVAFSARATGESAWLLLGLTGMGAALGAQAFWVVLGELLGVAAAWLLMARRFKRLTDRYDSITIPDYLESRFRDSGHVIRCVAAGALVVFVCIYVSAQIDATGKAFETFLGWNYFIGALVGFAVVVLYTTGGGFLAVVWSDVFQGMMMVIALVALPIVAIAAAGGPTNVLDGLAAQDPALLSFAPSGGWSLLGIASIASLLCIGIGFLGSPQIFGRFLALRSESEIGKGAAVAFVWTVLADSGAVLIGMTARHTLGIANEDALSGLVEHALPTLLVGIYIAVVLSAIMSTVDSLLIVATSALVRDWYQKVRHPELSDGVLLKISRRSNIALALVALALALVVAAVSPSRTVFWFVIFGWSGIAATFCPTVILSLFWMRFTARGALAAMITGFLSVPLFKFAAPALPGDAGLFFTNLGELVPSFLLSGATGILVSKSDPKGAERLRDIADDFHAAPPPVSRT